jgi:tetratricopeptide (TPR) repeat protein
MIAPTRNITITRVRAIFSLQQYDSAHIAYRRALALDPEYVEAMVGYGQTLVIRNEKDSAVRMFDRALEINPDYSEANYRKGLVWYEQKKYSEAVAMLTPVLIAQPQYYDAMLLMG